MCSTFARFDFILVPLPAARTTAVCGRVSPWDMGSQGLLGIASLRLRAGAAGFEPAIPGPKPGALPLGHGNHPCPRAAAIIPEAPAAIRSAKPSMDQPVAFTRPKDSVVMFLDHEARQRLRPSVGRSPFSSGLEPQCGRQGFGLHHRPGRARRGTSVLLPVGLADRRDSRIIRHRNGAHREALVANVQRGRRFADTSLYQRPFPPRTDRTKTVPSRSPPRSSCGASGRPRPGSSRSGPPWPRRSAQSIGVEGTVHRRLLLRRSIVPSYSTAEDAGATSTCGSARASIPWPRRARTHPGKERGATLRRPAKPHSRRRRSRMAVPVPVIAAPSAPLAASPACEPPPRVRAPWLPARGHCRGPRRAL